MELDARLRAFAAVARRSSFTRAAEQLGISQPAVSKHVADLEAAFGTPLVVREARGVRLTQAGEFLAGYVARAEALLGQAATGMAAIAGADVGKLTLAASGTPGVYLLPRVLASFAAERPDVEIEVALGTSATALDLLRAHRVELAVIGGASAVPDVELEPLVEDEIVIIGPPDVNGSRLSRKELERKTWLSREEGSATRMIMERAMDNLGLRPVRHQRLPDWEMIKVAVASGGGVAAISRFAVEHELATGQLSQIDLPGWHVVRPLSVARARDVPLTPLAAYFVAALHRTLGSGSA